MFICSFKWQNVKFVLSLFVSVCAIALVFTLVPRDDFVYPDDVLPTVGTVGKADLRGMTDNEKRVELLKKYGRLVESEPYEIKEVTIPEKFDAVYKKYNDLQLSEGFDLAKYKGETVKRYSYVVTNEEYDGTVIANLLVRKDRVIGGDVSTLDISGFVKGLTVGNDFIF